MNHIAVAWMFPCRATYDWLYESLTTCLVCSSDFIYCFSTQPFLAAMQQMLIGEIGRWVQHLIGELVERWAWLLCCVLKVVWIYSTHVCQQTIRLTILLVASQLRPANNTEEPVAFLGKMKERLWTEQLRSIIIWDLAQQTNLFLGQMKVRPEVAGKRVYRINIVLVLYASCEANPQSISCCFLCDICIQLLPYTQIRRDSQCWETHLVIW